MDDRESAPVPAPVPDAATADAPDLVADNEREDAKEEEEAIEEEVEEDAEAEEEFEEGGDQGDVKEDEAAKEEAEAEEEFEEGGDQGDVKEDEAAKEEAEEEFEEGGDQGDVKEDEAAKEVPEPLKEKRKQREFEVFVGGLPREATEEDLKEVFGKVGEVVEVRLVKHPVTKTNKGFAFVRFATVEQANKAAKELSRTQVRGKSCGVNRSNDNETLHVRNICTTWTKDDLMEKLKAFDLENLEEVHLIEDPKNKGKNRSYAFLDFCTHMDAVAACSKLQKRDVFFGTDVRAEVSFSKSVEPDVEVMAQVKSVFLDGLPATWDEDQLRERFKMFGEIESLQLARNMPTAKRKNFGFICFTTRQAALDCIEKVNKDGVGEGAEKVLLKATLKRPLPKRAPPQLGARRGYIDRAFGTRGMQPYGSHPFGGEPFRPHESIRTKIGDRPRGHGRLSSGRYGARDIPGVISRRTREPYMESSSRGISAVRGYRDHPPAYSHHSGGAYYDDMYDPRFEHHEVYEYPAVSGYKRSYAEFDHDVLGTTNSMTRRGRSRPSLEVDNYSQIDGSEYTEYSRFPPEELVGAGRREFPRMQYGSRYLSGSSASRYYY